MPLRPTALRPDATVASLTAASYAASGSGSLTPVRYAWARATFALVPVIRSA